MRLQGKPALIAGDSGAMGLATAGQFARAQSPATVLQGAIIRHERSRGERKIALESVLYDNGGQCSPTQRAAQRPKVPAAAAE